jgi:ethanolamine ammonia-lyase small subunit
MFMGEVYKSQVNDTGNKTYDRWSALKSFTPARIALGRTGTSVPLKEALAFKLAHANARDAVYSSIDLDKLYVELQQFNLPVLITGSKARNRQEYLQRPELGRQLDQDSLRQLCALSSNNFDVAIIIGDGLSAKAINEHAVNLLQLLLLNLRAEGYALAPLIVARNARVALGDEVGESLKAKLTVIVIGERPGLSSADSLGAYLTYSPRKGLTDEARNCVSNIRTGGLQYEIASYKIMFFIREALRRKISGVKLKDTLDPLIK